LGGEGGGGDMTQALYAHMNNKTIKIIKRALLEQSLYILPEFNW
jgi:hypothetical protein